VLRLDWLVAVGFGWLGVVGWLRLDWLACLACLVDCDWIESLLLAGFGFSAIFLLGLLSGMPDRDSVRWFVLLTEVAVRAFGPGFRLGLPVGDFGREAQLDGRYCAS